LGLIDSQIISPSHAWTKEPISARRLAHSTWSETVEHTKHLGRRTEALWLEATASCTRQHQPFGPVLRRPLFLLHPTHLLDHQRILLDLQTLRLLCHHLLNYHETTSWLCVCLLGASRCGRKFDKTKFLDVRWLHAELFVARSNHDSSENLCGFHRVDKAPHHTAPKSSMSGLEYPQTLLHHQTCTINYVSSKKHQSSSSRSLGYFGR